MSNRYYDGPTSDHFDGTRFYNPGQPSTDRSIVDGLRWKLGSKATPWPTSVPVAPTKPDLNVDGLRITMVGHATVLIQAAGANILTDPVWSERASPVRFAGPKRTAAPGIAFDDLPPIDAVLLSHCHYDHMDLATLRRLHDRDAPVMAMPLGNDTIVRQAIPAARIVVGDWHDRLLLSLGMTTTLTRANHSANRGLRDVRMALWAGHWLDTPVGSVWFAGDTGYGDGTVFTDLRRRMGSPDVALIPIGAYQPRWFLSAQHVDPDEAVKIFTDLEARQAIALHWGVFRLTDEGRVDPRTALARSLQRAGIDRGRFLAPEPGATVELGEHTDWPP